MASLEELAKSLKVQLKTTHDARTNETVETRSKGVKRRAWLIQDEDKITNSKGVDQPLIQKGSINRVYKPRLSTPFEILPKGVDQPLIQKGSIKGVYKPLSFSLQNLRGNPLKIIYYIFKASFEEVNSITRMVKLSEIMKDLDLTKDSARTAMRFLLKNGIIERVEFLPGKLGWSKYKIETTIFYELKEAYEKGFIDPLSFKGSNSSSSSKRKKTTTTKNSIGKSIDHDALDEGWTQIDISGLNGIGFTQQHLLQIANTGKLSPDVVQDSIHAFAFDLKHNHKASTIKGGSSLNYFMGTLRKGIAYAPPENYQTPEQEAMQLYNERKRLLQAHQQALEEEALNHAFADWREQLSDKQILEIVPSYKSSERYTKMTTGCLMVHFKEQVWLERKATLLNKSAATDTI